MVSLESLHGDPLTYHAQRIRCVVHGLLGLRFVLMNRLIPNSQVQASVLQSYE